MTNKILRRGEIWLINFDPTIGAEIKKTRPGLILSSDALGVLPLRIVAPITGWREEFKGNIWHVFITPNSENGLQKESAADCLQIKSLDKKRFIKKLGKATKAQIDESLLALLNILEFEAN